MDRIRQVTELIEPTLRDMGLELLRVLVSGGQRPTLQIMVERGDHAPVPVAEPEPRGISRLARDREFADETVAAFALPPEIADKYTLDIDLDAGPPPTFSIELTPKNGSPQEGDVTLTLNSDGVKSPAGKW